MCCPTEMLPAQRLSFTLARWDIILALAVEFLIWNRQFDGGLGRIGWEGKEAVHFGKR